MNIIIIGCGRVGSKFARVLSEDGHDVAVVSNDKNEFKQLGPDFDGITIAGIPIDQDVLKQAGIENADVFAAVTPDDNTNIMACQVAKEVFKVPRVIARIFNPEREQVFHHFGLDTICPTNLTVDLLRSKILSKCMDSTDCNIVDSAFTFRRESVKREYVGKKLNSVKVKKDSFIFGHVRKGSFTFPDMGVKLEKDDCLVIAYLNH